jgi:hypothetical protein
MKEGWAGQIRVLGASRYGPLLIVLTILLSIGPPLAEWRHGELAVAALFISLMLSAAAAVSHVPKTRRRLLTFALVVIAADTSLALDPAMPQIVAVGSLRAAFLAFVTIAILSHVVRTDRVTHDTILGGIVVYLLIGFFFQSAYGLVEIFHPGSFLAGDVAVSALPGVDRAHGRYPALVYYSFVTLSTVGFGDITPTWSLPQSLSTAEAVVGQLYLAILVASLVGMRLAGASPRPDDP